ncbi:MAG: hypothetical protein H9893_01685, partial [Candidatus Niameybacter stercoravium]|nr:hypothetical protein [Candidatus Niameybacter stercoravium]
MENTVLSIDVMSPKEWIMISHAITLEAGKIKIRASKAETTMAAYFNEATLFQIPVPDILKEPYNSYRIICTGYSTDALDAQIGITRYFEDDSNFTQFYEINKVIEIGSEGITAFSFVLKFIGTGEFSLQQLSITTFLNSHKYHTEHKSIKVNEVISKMAIPITGEKIYRSSVKMATILDEFSFKCFKEEAQ